MKALCIKAPWIQLIAAGLKTAEIRTKPTRYRGPLVLCCSVHDARSRNARKWRELVADVPCTRGASVCLVDLTDCRPAVPADEPEACCPIGPGEYVWQLANVRPLLPMAGYRGQLNFFEIPDELVVLKVAP